MADNENLDRDGEEFENYDEEGTDQDGGQELSQEDFQKLKEERDNLYNRVKQLNQESKKHRLSAKEYKELGDPDELRQIVEEYNNMQENSNQGADYEQQAQEQTEKVRKKLEEQYNNKLQEKDTELQTMQQSLESHLIDGEASRAISENDGIPELLMPHIKNRTQVVKDGNTYKTYVMDETGEPDINIDGTMKTVSDLVKEMKQSDVFSRAFKANPASGGGSNPSQAGESGAKRGPQKSNYKPRSEMTQSESRKAIKELGSYEEFRKLPW